MIKISDEWKLRIMSFLAWGLMNVICFTTRIKAVGYENMQALVNADTGFIMAIWHARTMLPIYYCRGMGIWAITATGWDGEIQTRVIKKFGYEATRGSSIRGGMKAALSAAKQLEKGGILAITPDGPVGPARQVHDGTVFLADRAKCPVLPLGVGIRHRKLMSSWDSYALPLPFSKAAIVFGEPIYLVQWEEGDPTAKEILKEAIDRVQQQAEQLVGEGM